ncbi:hypothetical protein [Gemmatimonas sp.]|uniref:hypothetical protein n=1 Tax=Gemmatimonas sp. TaxID=1962908 RepID=UPI00286EA0CA|nr:hypothetical protein [Gemmatimonas sp.]
MILPTFARRRLAPILASLVLAACDGLGAGVCEHTYRDPLLVLQSVTDARTGASLTRVSIRDVTVGGQPVRAEDLLRGPTRNATLDSGGLLCAADCGFATSPGRYRLSVAAEGYQPLIVERDAEYARFRGGCPSYNEGSSVIRLQLTALPVAVPTRF